MFFGMIGWVAYRGQHRKDPSQTPDKASPNILQNHSIVSKTPVVQSVSPEENLKEDGEQCLEPLVRCVHDVDSLNETE